MDNKKKTSAVNYLSRGRRARLALVGSIIIIIVSVFLEFVKPFDLILNSSGENKIEQQLPQDFVTLIKLNDRVNSFGLVNNIEEKQKSAYVEARFERLKYISLNKSIVDAYLIQNLDKKDTEEYQQLFIDYSLSIFNVGDNGNVPLPEYLTVTKEQDVKNNTDWFIDTAYGFFTYQDIYFLEPNLVLAIIVNKENSGAYNYDSYIYTFKIKNGKIEKYTPKLLSYNIKDSKVKALYLDRDFKNGVDVRGAGYFGSVYYEPKLKKIIGSTFKPFGLYPCSEGEYYDVYFDRLILTKTEVPEYCIGRDFTYPGSPDFEKLLEGQDDPYKIFDKIKVLYEATPSQLSILKNYDLTN